MDTSLQQNVICLEFARVLFQAHAQYFGLLVPDFDHLSPTTKQRWVESAQDAILAIGPSRPTLLREVEEGRSGKVCGYIDASHP